MSSNHATARLLEGHDAALQTMLRKAELAACIERQAPHEGQLRTAIHQLTLVRVNRVAHPVFTVCEPAVCLLARGSKRLVLADEAYVYDPDTYLVASQHLPVSGQVIDASPERPYLALRLNYDATDVASLLAGMRKHKRPIGQATSRGIATADVTPALLDAVLRLVRLLDTPQDIQALAPLTFREVLYRVLTGPAPDTASAMKALRSSAASTHGSLALRQPRTCTGSGNSMGAQNRTRERQLAKGAGRGSLTDFCRILVRSPTPLRTANFFG